MTPGLFTRLRIEELAEDAMLSLLQACSDISTLPITSYQDNELDDALSKIIVTAESQGEHAPGLGVHMMRVRVSVETDGTQVPEATMDLYWAAVMGIIYDSQLESDLTNAVPSLGVYARSALRTSSVAAKSTAEDRRIRTIAVDIRCYEQ